jgi:hypothetical protein
MDFTRPALRVMTCCIYGIRLSGDLRPSLRPGRPLSELGRCQEGWVVRGVTILARTLQRYECALARE